MRVASLCDTITTGIRHVREIQDLPDVEAFLVFYNPQQNAIWYRLFREVVKLLLMRQRVRNLTFLAKIWRRGRIRILHSAPDSLQSVHVLKSLKCDVALHGCGVIYRNSTIDSFRLGILNSHIGLLPRYRGRSVMEWSLLEGFPTGITVFFIDTGIDTGARIVHQEQIIVPIDSTVKDAKRFLMSLDGEMYRKAVQKLSKQTPHLMVNDVTKGKRYFVMSRLFSDVVNKLLSRPVSYDRLA